MADIEKTGKFKYLPHTAEAAFESYGKTLEEAFANAAIALFNYMGDTDKVAPKVEHQISIKANSLKSLLYDWLDEMVFLIDTKNFFINKVKSIKIEDNFTLNATVVGDDYKTIETHGDVKAITYHEMVIEEKEGSWRTQVTMDI
tara:strand:- start:27 stop:458 length:432 start_codon:yes stop_codon:yes gene_type:complete